MKNSKFTVLIPDRLKPPADVEREIFGEDTEIILAQAEQVRDIGDDVWARCDAVLAWHELDFTEDVLRKMSNCRVIVRIGVGYDNVDLKAAQKLGISVSNVPDYGTADVADHTMALILALSRGIIKYNDVVKEREWGWETGVGLRRLNGSDLGIIGLGRIGTSVALRAKAFGLNVRFYDPYLPVGVDKVYGIVRDDSLKILAENSDIITVHTPLTEETKGMVNDDFIGNCKDGVVLINTARGGIVDLDAVYRSLRSGKIRAAGLDVLPVEPPDWDHPMITAWSKNAEWIRGRLIITPHSAFYNRESYIEMRKKAAEEALRILQGQEARSSVF